MPSLLSACHITKRFGGVTALRDVSFDLQAGEIHALCGENGAGKSTLIKVLAGVHPAGSYEGEIQISGAPARFHSPGDAERAGVAVIYQELALVDELTVAENIALGHEPRRHGLIDWRRMYRQATELLQRFRVQLDPGARCGDLGIGQKQLVEIVKALGRNARILILDEPTAALAEHEVQVLLAILRDLRADGIGCIYISHRLDEVFALADRITVLRDGATVSTRPAAEAQRSVLIREMVGREITDLFPRRSTPAGDRPLLEVMGLSVANERGRTVLHDVSFSVMPGEVLGLGGLMGAGRTELLMHLFGAWGKRLGGIIRLAGREWRCSAPEEALKSGVALVTEDRRRYGLILEQSVNFNLSLSALPPVARRAMISAPREYRRNLEMSEGLRVKSPHLGSAVGLLSGGNQQKVVIGKALLTDPTVVFLDEPARGIDVGAKTEIYEIINRLTASGKAVVLVSSELPELLGMSDRILMLHEGRISGSFQRGEATQDLLMAAALGQGSSAL